MEEQIVGHDHRTQHTHDDKQRTLGHRRNESALQSLRPMNVNKKEFVDKRQPDHRHKPDDSAFHLAITVGEKHDKRGYSRQYRTRRDADSEEHLQGYGTAKYLGQRSGYAG